MTTVTVSFDPDVDDFEAVLSLVYAAFDEDGAPVDEPNEIEDPGPAPDGWRLAKMVRYVRELAPDGRRAFRMIAKNAPEAKMDIVKAAVGLDGMEYAGMMSTFGHATRKTRGVHSNPFKRHHDVYHIDPRVGSLAIQALDQIGA